MGKILIKNINFEWRVLFLICNNNLCGTDANVPRRFCQMAFCWHDWNSDKLEGNLINLKEFAPVGLEKLKKIVYKLQCLAWCYSLNYKT